MQYQGAGPAVNPVISMPIDAEDGVPGILKKMHGIMSDIGSVEKSQKNRAQGFSFRGIDQFQNKLHGLLIKHKVLLIPQISHRTDDLIESVDKSGNTKKQRAVNLVMKYTFMDIEDGSSISAMIPAEGLDHGDKATNKALSFAFKYCMIQLFSVPTEDMEKVDMTVEDGDSESPRIGAENVPEKEMVEKKKKVVKKSTAASKAEAEEKEEVKTKRFKRKVTTKVKEKEEEEDDL